MPKLPETPLKYGIITQAQATFHALVRLYRLHLPPFSFYTESCYLQRFYPDSASNRPVFELYPSPDSANATVSTLELPFSGVLQLKERSGGKQYTCSRTSTPFCGSDRPGLPVVTLLTDTCSRLTVGEYRFTKIANRASADIIRYPDHPADCNDAGQRRG